MTRDEVLIWLESRGEFAEVRCENVSERRMRLFGCACARRVEGLVTSRQARSALEVAERYADGAGPHGCGCWALEPFALPDGAPEPQV
jgi:hypothetical protein